jgi:hypothetical protein
MLQLLICFPQLDKDPANRHPSGSSAQTNPVCDDLRTHRKRRAGSEQFGTAIALSPHSEDLGRLIYPLR